MASATLLKQSTLLADNVENANIVVLARLIRYVPDKASAPIISVATMPDGRNVLRFTTDCLVESAGAGYFANVQGRTVVNRVQITVSWTYCNLHSLC
jgi:hypothetical protein